MRRVLIITYYWPPAGGSGVQRWLKFSKYLPSLGYQPVIYTPKNPERNSIDESLLKDIPAEAEILTTKIIEPYAIFRKLTGNKKKTSKETDINPINGNKKSLKMKLFLWIRANLFIPDPRCLWINPSVKYLRKYLKEHPVDAMISTGPPQSMHLIARKLHKKTGIKWIADFRDPWTEILWFKYLPLTSFSRKLQMKQECQVLNEADEIVCVTSYVRDEYGNKVNNKNKVHLIENGYDEDDFNFDSELDKKFTILHTGYFYYERNPKILWKVLATLCKNNPEFKNDLRIELIGKYDSDILDSIKEAGIEDNLVLKGYLPHHIANERQKACSVLLLSISTEPEAVGILPGKVFEYLAASRPILAFGLHNGVLDKMFEETGTGRLFEEKEEEELLQTITALYEKKELSFYHPVPDEIKRYSRKELAKEYVKLLD